MVGCIQLWCGREKLPHFAPFVLWLAYSDKCILHNKEYRLSVPLRQISRRAILEFRFHSHSSTSSSETSTTSVDTVTVLWSLLSATKTAGSRYCDCERCRAGCVVPVVVAGAVEGGKKSKAISGSVGDEDRDEEADEVDEADDRLCRCCSSSYWTVRS